MNTPTPSASAMSAELRELASIFDMYNSAPYERRAAAALRELANLKDASAVQEETCPTCHKPNVWFCSNPFHRLPAAPVEARAPLVTDTPWVSVFDRLPEKQDQYLCVVIDGEMHYHAIHFWNGKEWQKRGSVAPMQKPIAYWCELPQTWMLLFGDDKKENWIDYRNRLWNQLWPSTRVFTHEKAFGDEVAPLLSQGAAKEVHGA